MEITINYIYDNEVTSVQCNKEGYWYTTISI